ncbi:unnamed protein product [Paramecium pentaurelia]|uniref:Uncharacterized protein n=1 Tax=Paramecium pentaurelia TaxID=43138 RepID=A0A8S1S731_9CILI|nr:unnamed protein product [Paramecium pentaurelia]
MIKQERMGQFQNNFVWLLYMGILLIQNGIDLSCRNYFKDNCLYLLTYIPSNIHYLKFIKKLVWKFQTIISQYLTPS